MTATDGGTPARVGYTTVYFEVDRNQRAPVITSADLQVTILETDTARVIANVLARDDDLQVSQSETELLFCMGSKILGQKFPHFLHSLDFVSYL